MSVEDCNWARLKPHSNKRAMVIYCSHPYKNVCMKSSCPVDRWLLKHPDLAAEVDKIKGVREYRDNKIV